MEIDTKTITKYYNDKRFANETKTTLALYVCVNKGLYLNYPWTKEV